MARAGKRSAAARGRQRPAVNGGRRATIGVAVSVLLVIGLSARTIVQWDAHRGTDPSSSTSGDGSAAGIDHHWRGQYTDAELGAAASQLFGSVRRSIAEDGSLPDFAREKIGWLIEQRR